MYVQYTRVGYSLVCVSFLTIFFDLLATPDISNGLKRIWPAGHILPVPDLSYEKRSKGIKKINWRGSVARGWYFIHVS